MTRLHADARTTPLPRPRLAVRWRVGLLALFLLSVAIVVAANLAYAPFLAREYRRLDALDRGVMLTGDLVGWAGFAVVVVRHAVRGAPFAPPEAAPGRWDRFGGWLVAGMTAFLAVDAAATWLVRSRDEARQKNAVRVTATCDRVRPAGAWHVLDCRYADGTGAVHEVRFVVAKDREKRLMLLGDHDWKRVRAGAAPFPMTIGYDADHPGRCWPVGLVW